VEVEGKLEKRLKEKEKNVG
jgi:hypothetical protein